MKLSLQDRLSAAVKDGAPLIAVVAGSGEAARAAVQADCDVLVALNAGVYRNLGRGSLAAFLPYGNANEQAERLLVEHLLPQSRDVPVVAGMFAGAPDEEISAYFGRLKHLGVEGIANYPSVGMFDGSICHTLESEGFTIKEEIARLVQAQEMGFKTLAFVFRPEDVKEFVAAGVDALVLVLGVTRSVDDLREKKDQLQLAITRINAMLAEVKHAGRRLPCLAYGGPITAPEDLEQLLRFCAIDGFAGGTVFERLPMRDIISSTVRRFKSIALDSGQRTSEGGLGQMIGRSEPMKELFALIKRIAPYDVNVCIEGESGTGKELVATQIHRLSKRAQQAFVTLNCGAIPDTLLESELFGHEKGAFTGADRRRLGKFELAHRGTLFLDEIANLSPHGQVALLRAIQQREITRVGAENYIPVDVRILTASNQRLEQLVEEGRFRADLFHRLNQITLTVPPLRQRRHDIPLLVDDILSRLEIQLNRKIVGLSPAFLTRLQQHVWKGNVRELQHVILHAALREDGPVLEGRHFEPLMAGAEIPVLTGAGGRKDSAWYEAVRRALREARGNKSRAAASLGVTRKTLYAWLQELETAPIR
ncbi:MAG TPA: phosphoenolpyruvate hydrolase family protein [Planctomycetota bacterium]|nr:phosphoenolpyruvate hydrolase family protein [Planctomycetota bacterium]